MEKSKVITPQTARTTKKTSSEATTLVPHATSEKAAVVNAASVNNSRKLQSLSATKAVKNTSARTLPQTGEKENALILIGLGLAGLVVLIGLAEKKRRN